MAEEIKEDKITLPENLHIDLDESEEDDEEEETEEESDKEETEKESIEDIVSDTPTSPPPNIPTSNFSSNQFIAPQPRTISPVLESRQIPQQTNLEQELPETFTQTQPETAGQESQAYDAGSDYYVDNYQPSQDYPEVQAVNPTLNQSFTTTQRPRLNQTDTSWGPTKTQDWEKKYDIKLKENKRDRRRD